MITKIHINRTKTPRTHTKIQEKSVKKKNRKRFSCYTVAFQTEKITCVNLYYCVPDESEASFTQVSGNVVFKYVVFLLSLLVISSVLFVVTSLNIVVWCSV